MGIRRKWREYRNLPEATAKKSLFAIERSWDFVFFFFAAHVMVDDGYPKIQSPVYVGPGHNEVADCGIERREHILRQ